MDGVQPNYDSKNDHPPFFYNALIYTRAVTAPIYKVRTFLWNRFVMYVSCLSCCHVYLLQPCGHLLERASLLALLYVMFSCVFVTFRCGSGVVLDCIDS